MVCKLLKHQGKNPKQVERIDTSEVRSSELEDRSKVTQNAIQRDRDEIHQRE